MEASVGYFGRMSRPSRTRGLKPIDLDGVGVEQLSRPSRTRGLKQEELDRIAENISRVPRGRVD